MNDELLLLLLQGDWKIGGYLLNLYSQWIKEKEKWFWNLDIFVWFLPLMGSYNRLGFGVFLNNSDERDTGTYYDYNDYLPEACQINLDYAGKWYIVRKPVIKQLLSWTANVVVNSGRRIEQVPIKLSFFLRLNFSF